MFILLYFHYTTLPISFANQKPLDFRQGFAGLPVGDLS